MGAPDGAHTHGSSSGHGIKTPVLVVIILAGIVVFAAPVSKAVGPAVNAFFETLAITAGALIALTVGTVIGVWRWRRAHPPRALNTQYQQRVAAQQRRQLPPTYQTQLPQPQLQQPPVVEQHIHHHWEGVDPERIAEIMRRGQQ